MIIPTFLVPLSILVHLASQRYLFPAGHGLLAPCGGPAGESDLDLSTRVAVLGLAGVRAVLELIQAGGGVN